MTDREKLIEAFKSKASEWDSYDFDPDWGYSTEAAILADIALAVFREHTAPTGDERAELIRQARAEGWDECFSTAYDGPFTGDPNNPYRQTEEEK